MAEGLIDTREVANNIADLSGIIKNKAYRGSLRGNISNITTNNLVVGTHGNIVEALNLVSQSAHGRMSKEDKKKLDSIEAGSNKYIHPTTHPASMITEDAAKRFVSQAMVDGWNADIANRYTKAEIDNMISGLLQNIDWKESVNTFADLATTYPNPQDGWTVNVKDTDITYRWSGTAWIAISLNALPLATQTVDGKMSKEDKTKLDGIALNANNYVHPSTHPATMITEDATHRFVSDTEKSTWNNKANASHGNHVPTVETANNTRFLRNDNTWQVVTPGNIGAYTKSETYNRTEVDSKNYIKNAGTVTAHDGGGNTRIPNGIRVVAAYNNGYPESYGNVIQVGGTGDAELFLGWSGGSTSTSGVHANNYIRSKRDTGGTLWSGWAKLWTSANFNPASYLPLGGGTMNGPITKAAASCSWVNVKDGVNANIGLQQTAFNGWNPLIRIRSDGGWWGVGTYMGATNFNIVGFTDAQTVNSPTAHFRIDLAGNGVCSGTFSASRVYNAVWNDYAELFPKLKTTITEAGDIIALDIENNREVYTKATEETSSFIVGVHSDEYGQLLGGEKPPIDYEGDLYEFNKDKFIPVGLAGRVKAKCIGIIKKGDKLVISDIPGVARAFNPKLDNINNVFGMAVENKNNPDVISRVRMFIKN